LGETATKFETLDAKLSAALSEICRGELGRKITLKTEEEAKSTRLIRGRQILWMVYEDYRLNEEAGALHEITDLMKVTLRKDQNKIEHLSRFLLNWETILAGMKEPPPETTLQVLLYEQIRYLPFLSNDIAIFDRAAIGSEDRSYQFLIKAAKRVLERNRQERNRKDIERSLDSLTAGGGKLAALKGGKGRGKGKKGKGRGDGKGPKGGAGFGGGAVRDNNCREWMKSQTCARGKGCIYDHPKLNGWVFVAGAKARAKPKGDGKGNKGKDKKICSFFMNGNCRNGNQCNDAHPDPPIAAAADAKAKAKAKAKAAAKPSEQVNN
jgi:hypothetical protein